MYSSSLPALMTDAPHRTLRLPAGPVKPLRRIMMGSRRIRGTRVRKPPKARLVNGELLMNRPPVAPTAVAAMRARYGIIFRLYQARCKHNHPADLGSGGCRRGSSRTPRSIGKSEAGKSLVFGLIIFCDLPNPRFDDIGFIYSNWLKRRGDP
jgi:hypothetical protein